MFSLFKALSQRLKALFAADGALDFEAELAACSAERKADLLRQADRYAGEGLHGIAQHLRDRAEALSPDRPLAGVLPALEHWQAESPASLSAPSLTDAEPSSTRRKQLTHSN